jgi:succinyl-diaminopimelate desuccinylase
VPDPIRLLQDLVALPSVNPSDGEPDDHLRGESRVVDYLEGFFARHGVPTRRQTAAPGRENLLARLEGRSSEITLLEAHTDTVSVEGMTIPPFEPRIADGRLFGRGSCDCKASLAAMAVAMIRAARRGVPPRSCLLAATCGEEYKFTGARALVDRPAEAGLSTSDFARTCACVGEPTALQVIIAHKGAFRWRIRTAGRASHSSDPERGDNAIYHMADLIAILREYAASLADRPRHPLVGGPKFSVGIIQGGSAVNIVPDQCEILVDRRLIPGEVGPEALEEIRGFVAGRVPFEAETLLEDWPLETSPEASIVRRTRAAVAQVLGQSAIGGVAYGTDASKYHRSGIESIVCGPGDIAQAHTAEEWVDTSQVEAAARVYEHLIMDE